MQASSRKRTSTIIYAFCDAWDLTLPAMPKPDAHVHVLGLGSWLATVRDLPGPHPGSARLEFWSSAETRAHAGLLCDDGAQQAADGELANIAEVPVMQRRALLSRWLEVTQLTGVSLTHIDVTLPYKPLAAAPWPSTSLLSITE